MTGGDGLVVAAHGRHCLVEIARGHELRCHPRGKKNEAVVGDRVRWARSGDEGLIEAVLPRRNLFYRQDEVRTKSFAANLDHVLVLVAAEPVFSEPLLARALMAAEAQGIPVSIALNKRDRSEAFDAAWKRLQPYRQMDVRVLPMSLRAQPDAARALMAPLLDARATLVVGPSGAGKSTLVNLLAPQAGARTGDLSRALSSGRHTTTATRWYWIDGSGGHLPGSAIVDSPGFQTFGLQGIEATRLATLMPDLRPHLGRCRFANCSHRREPGCAVRAATDLPPDAGGISISRYRIYTELFEELSQTRY